MSFGTDEKILKCSRKIILGAVGGSQGSTHGATHRMSIGWIGGNFSMHVEFSYYNTENPTVDYCR